MKKLLLLSILYLFISYSAFGQKDGNYNYSVGIEGFSLKQMPKIFYQTNSQDYTSNYLDGILIKFNDNQISYRLRGNYNSDQISFSNQCLSCEVAEGKFTNYSFTVGFEKNVNYARIQPYFGTDIGFKVSEFTGEVSNVNPKSTAMPYSLDTDKNGFVISPLIGIKVSPAQQISLFVETSLDLFYSYERQETIQHDSANTRSFAKYNKWEFLLSPISVGIQVHFVNKN